MNDEAVSQIDKATVAHALWKIRLDDATRDRGAKLDRTTAADCHACAFGKWLDSGASGLASHADFAEINELHAVFHRSVGLFIDRLRAGGNPALHTSLGEGGSIRDISSRLALSLLRWRDKLSMDP